MIEFDAVSKYFPTVHGRRYVLRDSSFTIADRSKIGVLGRNGAGKTSLMRLISGVDVPQSGKIIRRGNISWPMGLASGTIPTMTGRESARFSCRIYGVPFAEIKERVEAIEAFSELGDYFDMLVKTYSSGMRARLNFAIAVAFEFDFYVIDELTAVGDASFKKKSYEQFQELRSDAGFIKVSHNIRELQRECEQGMVLEDGVVRMFDDINEAIDFYDELIGAKDPEAQRKQGWQARQAKRARQKAKKQRIAARRRALTNANHEQNAQTKQDIGKNKQNPVAKKKRQKQRRQRKQKAGLQGETMQAMKGANDAATKMDKKARPINAKGQLKKNKDARKAARDNVLSNVKNIAQANVMTPANSNDANTDRLSETSQKPGKLANNNARKDDLTLDQVRRKIAKSRRRLNKTNSENSLPRSKTKQIAPKVKSNVERKNNVKMVLDRLRNTDIPASSDGGAAGKKPAGPGGQKNHLKSQNNNSRK